MPIYKYECNTCGHIFEDLRGFNDPNPDECPECGEHEVRRLISGGNFHLKGSGWYVTEYGDENTSGAPAETSADAGDGEKDSAAGGGDDTEAA